MNSRDRQREATKRRIYDVAFQLFAKRGFENVKVADIAKAADVSVGSVYYHYTSKEAIIDYGYYEFDQELQAAYEKHTFDSSREGIEFLISYQIKSVEGDLGCALTAITFKNQMNGDNTYHFSDERYINRMLLDNLEKQPLKHLNSVQAAAMILRMSRGVIYDWCCRQGAYSLKATVALELNIILEYIGL